ncbi:ABC transporter permease [Rhodopirellula sp. MGV]|uniref:ABC transporter permease n=1 Tax=Rhodopirellula sp. MGV TaxID=2023130 RepID=UPI000B97708B|nr:ABC transporter permease [Rhodopirellula sp. MGV]OYP38249.1 ABC transporter substrate-binding protein [Rhodopirellula sp. MGV]PNY38586.1 ABC transporter permease [Rhodopirellula baltica]
MLLPWEYGIRNLARRPVRTSLTLVAMTTVVVLILVVVGFVRGLERSLSVSGDREVVLVYSINSAENIENSSIAAQTPRLLTASLSGIWKRFGVPHVSPELYMGIRVGVVDSNRAADLHDRTNTEAVSESDALGLVRGVTSQAPLVRRDVRILSGDWPGPNEVMVGELAAAKLGLPANQIVVGNTLEFESQQWRISGTFSAGGSAYESEIWCNLPDIQSATKRQDLSLVAIRLPPGGSSAEAELFCKERIDLEIQAIRETQYYGGLQQHYGPVRHLAWMVVILVAAAGFFAGMNMMYGAVSGRVREIATLQAMGFRRIAIVVSLVQEGVLLAATASLIAGGIALLFFRGVAIRFTMGAFPLEIDGVAILIGSCVGLVLGALGAMPPAFKALRQSVAVGLKSI